MKCSTAGMPRGTCCCGRNVRCSCASCKLQAGAGVPVAADAISSCQGHAKQSCCYCRGTGAAVSRRRPSPPLQEASRTHTQLLLPLLLRGYFCGTGTAILRMSRYLSMWDRMSSRGPGGIFTSCDTPDGGSGADVQWRCKSSDEVHDTARRGTWDSGSRRESPCLHCWVEEACGRAVRPLLKHPWYALRRRPVTCAPAPHPHHQPRCTPGRPAATASPTALGWCR